MGFRDLSEFMTVEPFPLPINGKVYKFPGEISAKSWLQLQRLTEQITQAQVAIASGEELDPDIEVLSDADESALMAEMFGGVDDEMVADGCTSSQIKAVFFTLMAYHIKDIDAAEAVWNAQGESSAPSRTDQKTRSVRPRGSRDTLKTQNSPEKVPVGQKSSSDGN